MEVFTIYSDEIIDRLDAQFYVEKISTKGLFTLGEFVDVKGGKRIPKGSYYSEIPTDYFYLRVDNIDDNGFVDYEGMQFISSDLFDFLRQYRTQTGDVIISIAGTIGKTAYIETEKNVILTENCAKLLVKDNSKLLAEYLNIALQSEKAKKQISQSYIQTTIPKLGLDRIRNLKISIPSIDKQLQIINIIEKANSIRKSNLLDSEILVESVDTYVLSQLGIEIPSSTNEKVFTVYSDEIVNERIDPYYYQPNFYAIIKSIKQSSYPYRKLVDLIDKLINGFDFRDFQDSGTPYLKVANIKPYRIDFTKESFIDLEANSISKDIVLRKGDLLLTRKGTYGVAVSIKEDLDYIICSEIFKIILKNEVKSDYLEIVLNSSIGRTQFDRNKIGAIMGSLSQEAVGLTYIPIPPLEVQEKIVEEVQNRLKKAEALKLEAFQVLKNAKIEVDKILLGK